VGVELKLQYTTQIMTEVTLDSSGKIISSRITGQWTKETHAPKKPKAIKAKPKVVRVIEAVSDISEEYE